MIQMKLFTKQKEAHRQRKQTYVYQGVKGVRRDRLGAWDSQILSITYKIHKQSDPIV